MKRAALAVWLALGATWAGCSTEAVPQPPAPPVNFSPQFRMSLDAGPAKATERERAAAANYSKAMSSAHFTGLGSVLNEDAHSSFAGMKDAYGRDKVIEAHEALFGAFEDRKFVTSRVWLTDSAQALQWSMTGVQAREWIGVPPTHKPVTIEGVTLLWTNDDGSVTDVHVTFDEAVVKMQLGAGPKDLVALPAPHPPTAGDMEILEQTRSREEAANVDVVKEWLSALEKGDEAGYLAATTDDVEVSVAERVDPMRGKDGMKGYFKSLRKEIAELDTSIDNIWGVRDFVVVEYFIIGAQVAPIGWVPLEHDRLLKLSVVDIVEMKNGKIARVRRYDNPLQILSSP